MRNELTIKVRMPNCKQQKPGDWEIRVWNLLSEYFNIDHWELSWNPNAKWEEEEK